MPFGSYYVMSDNIYSVNYTELPSLACKFPTCKVNRSHGGFRYTSPEHVQTAAFSTRSNVAGAERKRRLTYS
jgi:hypothetical protein